MIKLVKIGDILYNHTEDIKTISFVMIDIDNKDKNIANLSCYVLENDYFTSKYTIMRSKDIVKIENTFTKSLDIDTKISKHSTNYGLSTLEGYKIKEVIDFIIITEKNIYVIDDISYYRDIKLKKLGL